MLWAATLWAKQPAVLLECGWVLVSDWAAVESAEPPNLLSPQPEAA